MIAAPFLLIASFHCHDSNEMKLVRYLRLKLGLVML
mgnify:CR=1 FL=1